MSLSIDMGRVSIRHVEVSYKRHWSIDMGRESFRDVEVLYRCHWSIDMGRCLGII